MARTKEIRYIHSQTINTGNFENVKVEIGEVVELEKGDDVKKEYQRLVSRVTKLAEAEVSKYEDRSGKSKK